jgi:phenylacetate-CoA ligase
MSGRLLNIYNLLPAQVRPVAAGLRGLYLRAWRYGPETDRLVEQALERERWGPKQWRAWREERLAYVLHRATTKVPYYREYWHKRRMSGGHASYEFLENWPILEKESVRANPRAFVADDCDPRRMFHEHTSGTTGKSLDLWWSLATVRQWYALFEARCRLWYGVSRHDRWAVLGGQLVTPAPQHKPPFWIWNWALNQLYCSSYHLTAAYIPAYLDALIRYRVRYLWGYTSALYELAQTALELNGCDIRMAVTITNAEPLFDYQRAAIEQAFACKVRETYGLAEIVAAASECESGNMHLWPEAGWVEVLDGEHTVADSRSGELVCTGLLNVDMPLIRYRTGDTGALVAHIEQCSCGRTLPVLQAIEGRVDDLLYTADGRRIGRLDPVFKVGLPVREAQIVQETLSRLCVRFVPAPEYTSEAGRSLIERLQARVGKMEVVLEEVDRVPRMSNGKFRAVICNLPQAERRPTIKA